MTKDDDGLQTDFSATRCTWGSSLGSILDFDPVFFWIGMAAKAKLIMELALRFEFWKTTFLYLVRIPHFIKPY